MKLELKILIVTLFVSSGLLAQIKLKGSVHDAKTSEVLIGATVQVEGTNDAAKTNNAGEFEINTSQKIPFTLLLHYVGYSEQEYIIATLDDNLNLELRQNENLLNSVVVTSRRRNETAREIPIPVSVINGPRVSETGAFNVNRLKELVPSVQLYSSNPRNTGLSIRGLGTTFGLTNDGIDPGVGFYVDGVYYARTAATTLDFIDIEQIEVLRGAQGTLFGKNTTAGAFNITTKKPSFTSGANFELSYGNYGYIQAKTSLTGPLSQKLAARVSFSGTQRNGTIYNQKSETWVNDQNNLGIKGQLLFNPNSTAEFILSADASSQRPRGSAQVFAGVVTTKRASYRQYSSITSDLGYTVPSTNPFDRIIDQDTPARSFQDLGGVSLNTDVKLGNGKLTSTTAWRYWNWDPSNDRDFTGLQALRLSQAPSKHNQYSQEVRWAGNFGEKISAVFGLFAFYQKLKSDTVHTEESGVDQWRFAQNTTSALWATPGLLDGYGIKTKSTLENFSGAIFGQADWTVLKKLHILPGIRINYDSKYVDYNRQTYGGLQTTDPALIKLKKAVYSDQAFTHSINNTNYSGQITVKYEVLDKLNAFATYSTGYKPVGLNLGGLPTNTDGTPMLNLAVIKPERVNHVELVLKSSPTKQSSLNLTVYNTDIKDYQTQVQSAELGVNRGYLANAEHVRVRGAELEGDYRISESFTFNGSFAFTDATYVKFTNAPLPLEETGQTVNGVQVAFKDVSGGRLPGVSKYAGSFGTEYSFRGKLLGNEGRFFIASDLYFRSEFSSSPSPSKYLNIDGYALVNARLGFRTTRNATIYLWGRNITDTKYFEQLLPGAGNSGQYAGVLGDPCTYGVTLKYSL